MPNRNFFLLCLCLALAGGCNVIYKQNVQQGNALEQEDLDELRLGMTQTQVAFLLGTPAIQDPFHHDRWDYISTFSRRGSEPAIRKVTLRFDNEVLVEMDGVDDDLPADDSLPRFEAPPEEPQTSGSETAPEEAAAEPVDSAEETETPAAEAEQPAPAAAATLTPLAAPEARQVAYDPAVTAAAPAADSPTPAAAQTSEPMPSSPPAPAAAAKPSAEGQWGIQLGAFASRDNAAALQAQLAENGLKAVILTQTDSDGSARHLVRYGGLTSEDEAKELLDDIEAELGLAGFLVAPSD